MNGYVALIDEHDQPSLRATLGRLLTSASQADIAIAHLRLAGLDLTPSETGTLERCRVMLGHLDATMLFGPGAPGDAAARLRLLTEFAQSGKLEIRTAPHHTWNPDFSVFAGLPGGESVALLGAHYFGRPYPRFGLAFTCVLRHERLVAKCTRRFEQLWEGGYDVLPVVQETLRRLAG